MISHATSRVECFWVVNTGSANFAVRRRLALQVLPHLAAPSRAEQTCCLGTSGGNHPDRVLLAKVLWRCLWGGFPLPWIASLSLHLLSHIKQQI